MKHLKLHFLLAIAALACVCQPARGAIAEAWARRYNNIVSNSHDIASAVLRDPAGNIIVAGYTEDGFSGRDLVLLKYSGADGSLLWQQRFDGVDLISGAAVDAHGNVAVAGHSSNAEDYDYFTVKYSSDGALVWARHYDGPSDDKALAVAFDASGNVVVTGGSSQDAYRNDDDDITAYDYYTAKYAAADGAILWERRYNGPANRRDLPRAMAIDASDNVVIAGSSDSASTRDHYTVKYAGADGTLLWEHRHQGPTGYDILNAVAFDASGNVVVAGSQGYASNQDIYAAKYAAADGALVWERLQSGPGGTVDAARAVAVDGSGNVIITGGHSDRSFRQTDIYTAKYAGADGTLLWEEFYNGPTGSSDSGQALAVDANGNVVVTGYSLTNNSWDIYTAKYAAMDGALLWDRRQNGPLYYSENLKSALVLDDSGNVVVAGSSSGGHDPDIYTAKYAAADGSVLWEQRHNGPAHRRGGAQAVVIDAQGNVFVTGHSEEDDSDVDYLTVKYAPNGTLLWERRYNGPGNGSDSPQAIALDSGGNVVVTGYSQSATNGYDYYTAKYAAADGTLLWERHYNGPGNWSDAAYALAVDASGNVVVTGNSDSDYYTAKYAAADGALLWERRFHNPLGYAAVVAMAMDPSGNVAVTGTIWTGNTTANFYTVKYAAIDGAQLWERQYNRPDNGYDEAAAVATDANGNVFVTGRSGNFYTAKYAAADGALVWEKRYSGPSGYDAPAALAVDANGNAIVTGFSYDENSAADAYTIKYAAADGTQLWARRAGASPSNSTSAAAAVALDESGNVVVAGISYDGHNNDFFTAKYAAADGAVLWEQRDDGPGLGDVRQANLGGLALGPNGMVAMVGSSGSFQGYSYEQEYTTVVYREGLEPISIALVPGGVRLRFTGEPGRSYAVQRAPALTGPWDTVGTPSASPDGLVEYLDSSPLPNSAFYRSASITD